MGHLRHDTLLIQAQDWRIIGGEDENTRLRVFRDAMPDTYRGLLIGPIFGVVNLPCFWALMPDGSADGKEEDLAADTIRDQLIALVRSFEYPHFVYVQWGGDGDGVSILDFDRRREEG